MLRQGKVAGIRDVARLAGVSISTVSRTQSGIHSVDKKLARKVKLAIDELGYVPNRGAGALAGGRSRLLGLLIPTDDPIFLGDLALSFLQAASSLGYEVLVYPLGADEVQTGLILEKMLQRQVEGIAAFVSNMGPSMMQELSARGLPKVCIGSSMPVENCKSVVVNYAVGIREAVQHLAVLGHRKIAFIGESANLQTAQAKRQAFLQSIEEIGCKPRKEWLLETDACSEVGTSLMRQIFINAQRPTAVICATYNSSVATLIALCEIGISVPDDVSLIGFDLSRFVGPTMRPLTTIETPLSEISRVAVNALHSFIEHPRESAPFRGLEVHTVFVKRGSTTFPFGRKLSTHKSI